MSRRPLPLLALSLLALAAASPFAAAQEAFAGYGSKATPVAGAPHVGSAPVVHVGASGQGAHVGPRVSGFGNYGKRWVPGHWTVQVQRVFEPGRSVRVWVPPVYETHYDACGNPYRVLVCAGRHETRTEPGRWVSKRVRVWVAGRWC